ncbi:hypothetical protein V1514DRAFT_354925 [Lipomyces japonicus]|uniref:uncharacterized protein n=1 Tax=Lipomyces japonicus TaxID=56871 RepID=UPI0034D0049B
MTLLPMKDGKEDYSMYYPTPTNKELLSLKKRQAVDDISNQWAAATTNLKDIDGCLVCVETDILAGAEEFWNMVPIYNDHDMPHYQSDLAVEVLTGLQIANQAFFKEMVASVTGGGVAADRQRAAVRQRWSMKIFIKSRIPILKRQNSGILGVGRYTYF